MCFASRSHAKIRLFISSDASTSTYVNRVQAEQAAVESRLIELDGMETINTGLRRTVIRGEGDMIVDPPPEPPTSRAIEAKRKALAQFVRYFTPFRVIFSLIRCHRASITTHPVWLALLACKKLLNWNDRLIYRIRNVKIAY